MLVALLKKFFEYYPEIYLDECLYVKDNPCPTIFLFSKKYNPCPTTILFPKKYEYNKTKVYFKERIK